MKLGKLEIEKTAVLAPMAGVCDAAYRSLCHEYGSAYQVSEMVSIKGIEYEGKKTFELMRLLPGEHPVGIQLFGHEPESIALAAKVAEQSGADFVDINMGCPAPKITGNGGGSALLKTPALCGELVRSAVRATSLPVTAKIRIGWDAGSINCVEVARILEASGVSAIAVHGRTREQFYAPSADWSRIAEVKQAVSVPVIGNGDITSPEDALRMYRETGCDLVMVGRAAMGRPWLFAQIAAACRGEVVPSEPSPEEKVGIMRKHILHMAELKGEHLAYLQARNHLSCYVKGLKGAARLRESACRVSNRENLEHFFTLVLEENA